ncbi:T9SS type A sorting domain-containing protein [Hymenobacter sp. BT770]|uniref:T9SS type A sorting domain-containing protein n=1 Tax=Hymenobacter sp. BT770 TaxID=2886942 RepID=UPI001D125E6A|nr:T9SS type A sorting domain-containing protein [Hymenobacter sp. BT770]MCC3151956.1 T9SS type A sorting domain-containing protein [Hymenobacter sp. BT770]MDO3417066.1 T9SS type A sorting domain-containing protein [Hymenobacter sp. BT770]
MKPIFHIPLSEPKTFKNMLASLIAIRGLRLLLALLILLSTRALAQTAPDPSTFCDGLTSDWNNFQTVYPTRGYAKDFANSTSNGDDQFTGGSKDGDKISAWRWSLGNANAKGDITNAGAALAGANNCTLRFFGDRTSNNGDASIGFWFFVSDVHPNTTGGTFSGEHQNGDLLILSDFTGGGTTPTIKAYVWTDGKLVEKTGSFCAEVNHIDQPVPTPLSYTASNGSKSYAPNLFYEGAVNLCDIYNTTSPPCFAAFLVETRNSQSITASLQDFAASSFNGVPDKPKATVDQPTCVTATGTVNVTNPISGYTYTLTGPSPATTAVTSTTGTFSTVASGTYGLTAKSGTCESAPTMVVVNTQPPNPARPVVTLQEATICGTNATPTVTVLCPVSGKYTFKQTGETDKTFTYTGSNGPVKFNVVPGLGGFSITVTTGLTSTNTVGCVSDPTNCSNYTTNVCPSGSGMVVKDPAPIAIKSNIQTEAYPNPTGRDATINFSVPKSGRVIVQVYNSLGARVATIFDGEVKAGENRSVILKGASLQSGTYTYRVIANGTTKSNRISLIK